MNGLNRVGVLRERLRDLPLPEPFTVEALAAAIAERRGRPLRLEPISNPAGPLAPSGAWVATEEFDIIAYAEGASPLHRDLIILHELGHVWLDHRPDGGVPALSTALPDLDPAVVLRILNRHAYGHDDELDAEMFGHLVLERTGERPAPGSPWIKRLRSSLQQARRS